MQQLPLALGPDTHPGFEQFLPGQNAQVLQCLMEMAIPGPPVYLHGPSGSGKTHLLAALATRLREQGFGVGWFDADTPLPWEFQDHWAMVVLDRVDEFDAARQHGAFVLFIEAASWSVQLAAAGRLPPGELQLRDDLRSRLAWGLVLPVQPLDEAGMRQALLQEASRRGMYLASDVLEYLLTRQARDLPGLMQLLARLDGFSLAQQRQVTIPLLKKMLAEEGPSL